MRIKKLLLGAILFSFLFALSGNAQDNFWDKLKNLRWIGYAPTNFNPDEGIYPSLASIRRDLHVIYNEGFTGVVTYGSQSTLRCIPKIAKEVGFKGVIMGIWDIKSREEVCGAINAREYVDGYSVGNEGYQCRYQFHDLKGAVDFVRLATGKPTTTTEQLSDYYRDEKLLAISDWVFINVHPYFNGVRKPDKAVRWVKERIQRLARLMANKGYNKLIVVKETGFPTNGDKECIESSQQEFLKLMEESGLIFVYFEAFDQTWKRHLPIEPHWGLFDCSRRPKQYIRTNRLRCWLYN